MGLNIQSKHIICFPRQFSIWTDTHFVPQFYHLFVPLLLAGTLVVGRKAEKKSNPSFLSFAFRPLCKHLQQFLNCDYKIDLSTERRVKISKQNLRAVQKFSLLLQAGNVSQQCYNFFLPWLTGFPEFALFGLLYFDIIFLSFVSCTSCSSTGWFLFTPENVQLWFITTLKKSYNDWRISTIYSLVI